MQLARKCRRQRSLRPRCRADRVCPANAAQRQRPFRATINVDRTPHSRGRRRRTSGSLHVRSLALFERRTRSGQLFGRVQSWLWGFSCMPARKVPRSICENARDVARDITKTETYVTSRRERKKIETRDAVCTSQAHPTPRSAQAVHLTLKTSSCWLPPPRISESWQSWSRCHVPSGSIGRRHANARRVAGHIISMNDPAAPTDISAAPPGRSSGRFSSACAMLRTENCR